ncbi:MAG: diaminopimelate dehydrogenase [Oscillospiraceae bacterium]|jgi:diaminopimelate dehydrogenase|nr:diaminopimelate dehydrogenase [Oscillospiraceae bacterium]
MSIRVGIAGYGNLGKGVELAVSRAPDMELTAVLSRRNPTALTLQTPGVPVYALDEAGRLKAGIDVIILCGGSAKDLPAQGPQLAAMFNTVDSFDAHTDIPAYLSKMDTAATDTTAIISSGWDPGLFSMMRMLSGAVLPDGNDYTFWGYGVSQGHSNAIRGVEGVRDAVQYTVPLEAAVSAVRSGANPSLTAGQKHLRECFVVPEEGADLAKIEESIRQMPYYFAGYETIVRFVSQEELLRGHAGMPHGGHVFRTGVTGGEHKQVMEFSLKLDSNPEFTASVMTACARAAVRLSREGVFGAKTVFDIPLSYLSPTDRNTLIKELL